MNRRGVCYDVGRVMWGQSWRPDLSDAEARRELRIIRDDLHCNAVRICGESVERLAAVAAQALDLGLEVWLSPELWDRSPAQTLDYLSTAAAAAQRLCDGRPGGEVVFSVGSELTLFMAGIVEGGSVFERLNHPSFWETVRSGRHNGPLNAFLAEARRRVRRVYGGKLTYAAVPLEAVDWSGFDFVSADLYRDARVRERFRSILRGYFAHGRPVAITEFGCCTYRGAADAGGRGFEIVDTSSGEAFPSRVRGGHVRDEDEQARELEQDLRIFAEERVDATFVMTFVEPLKPFSKDPRYDLDMASYSLVKSYGGRLGPLGRTHPDAPWDRERHGTTYPDMPWEPKEAFRAVAAFYGGHAAGAVAG